MAGRFGVGLLLAANNLACAGLGWLAAFLML